MPTEERFNRLEDKVDRVKDEVTDVKTEMILMNDKFDRHLDIVENHILGDQKIINTLETIIPELADMASSHKAEKIIKERKAETRKVRGEKLKNYGMMLGFVSTLVGIIVGISRIT